MELLRGSLGPAPTLCSLEHCPLLLVLQAWEGRPALFLPPLLWGPSHRPSAGQGLPGILGAPQKGQGEFRPHQCQPFCADMERLCPRTQSVPTAPCVPLLGSVDAELPERMPQQLAAASLMDAP